MVIVTREDLTHGYQAQQSTHSIADYAAEFPTQFKDWKQKSNSIILLSVKNEIDLDKLYNKLSYFTDVVKFYEPDLNDELTSICLYASPELRKKLSNLPLLGKPPKITYQSILLAMADTPQTDNQSVLEHGISVYNYFKDLYNHLTSGTDLKHDWKLPEWLSENKDYILSNLYDLETCKEYQILHDIGKPYCLLIDSDGKRHYPDHANVSADTYLSISTNKVVADLIRGDMTFHIIKSEQVPDYVDNNPLQSLFTLLVTSLCELHSNASLFGGIQSDSFKMKYKQIDKRGKQVIKLLKEK